MNEKYSYKDFTHQRFTDADDFTGEIEGSCFYQEAGEDETPPFDVFPADMTGVTFKKCNLDNCVIPDGNTVEGGCNRVIKVQNDWQDWVLNKGEPTEPTDKKKWERKGVSIDPKDIPAEKMTEEEAKEFKKLL